MSDSTQNCTPLHIRQRRVRATIKYKARLRREGMCVDCCTQKVRPNRSLCERCGKRKTEKTLSRQRRRLASGLCRRCGNPALFLVRLGRLGSECEECFLKRQAFKLGYSVPTKAWVRLRDKLRQQNFTCPYSGIPLVIGSNASIDHIVARARGGSNELENIQWVDIHVNYAKRALSESEFIEICKAVARHRG